MPLVERERRGAECMAVRDDDICTCVADGLCSVRGIRRSPERPGVEDSNARPFVPSQAHRLRCRYSPGEKLCFRTRQENILDNSSTDSRRGFLLSQQQNTNPPSHTSQSHRSSLTKNNLARRHNHFPSIRHPPDLCNAPNPPDQGSIYKCQPCHAR